MSNVRDFKDDLEDSLKKENDLKIKKCILERYPGAKVIQNLANTNDSGIDYFVIMDNKTINIDVKIRDIENKYDDLALELWSVKEQGKVGWLEDTTKLTDVILWIYQDGFTYFANFKELQKIFTIYKNEWIDDYFAPEQKTRYHGQIYTSQCIMVPIDTIEQKLFEMALE